MAITLKFTQLNRKKKKNGEIPIYLRITEHRKARYLSTGLSVKEEDWNSTKEEVRKSHPLYKKLNHELLRIKLNAEEEKLNLNSKRELNSESLKSKLKLDSNISVADFGQLYLEELKELNRYWEQRHFSVLLNDLSKSKLDAVPVSSVNHQYILQLKQYFFSTVSTNTVRKKLQRFKGMTKYAIQNGLLIQDPFQLIEPVKRVKSYKPKLSVEQIDKIKNLQLKQYSFQWHVRNYFMFSYYCAGIRFSDVCTLKPENIIDGRLRYSMQKTSGEKSIKLRNEHFEILSHYNTTEKGYIFPLLPRIIKDEFTLKKKISSCNVLVNKALKSIAKKAEISENVSFHVSRHSFAHNALKSGMDLYSISKALGHSDIKITELYLKSFDEEMLDSSMDKFFNN